MHPGNFGETGRQRWDEEKEFPTRCDGHTQFLSTLGGDLLAIKKNQRGGRSISDNASLNKIGITVAEGGRDQTLLGKITFIISSRQGGP